MEEIALIQFRVLVAQLSIENLCALINRSLDLRYEVGHLFFHGEWSNSGRLVHWISDFDMLMKFLNQKVYKVIVDFILNDESFVIIACLTISMKTPAY